MAAMMIRCPTTGQAVSTQIETEPQVFRDLPDVSARLRCPLCREEHVWSTAEAWLGEPLLLSPVGPAPALPSATRERRRPPGRRRR